MKDHVRLFKGCLKSIDFSFNPYQFSTSLNSLEIRQDPFAFCHPLTQIIGPSLRSLRSRQTLGALSRGPVWILLGRGSVGSQSSSGGVGLYHTIHGRDRRHYHRIRSNHATNLLRLTSIDLLDKAFEDQFQDTTQLQPLRLSARNESNHCSIALADEMDHVQSSDMDRDELTNNRNNYSSNIIGHGLDPSKPSQHIVTPSLK
ncbi:MAG: hypothetical protein JOS17DRAFT_792409 [Linnemannia elongata]|nr:MAG: hypothetical protein JOS17DRAFT_792409 [Linnemannia elongata]